MDQKVNTFINEFNNGWTMAELEKVADLMDDNVVFVAPDLKSEIKGREKCLQTLKDYLNVAQTQNS